MATTDYEPIRKEFETTNLTLQELADKYGVKFNTLKSKKARDKWKRNPAVEKVKTKHKSTKKRAALKQVASVKEKKEKKGAKKGASDATHEMQKGAKKDEPLIDGLKEWEWGFCYEYIQHHNATKAYMAVRETTYGAARTLSAQLLAKVRIREVIRAMKDEMYSNSIIRVEDIKRELEKIIFVDYNDLVKYGSDERIYLDEATGLPMLDENEDRMTYVNSYLSFKDMDRIDGSIIQEVRMGRDGPVIKTYDKVKAMQLWLTLVGQGNGPTQRDLQLMKLKAELELTQSQLLKARIENGELEPEEVENDGFIEALGDIAADETVWPKEVNEDVQ